MVMRVNEVDTKTISCIIVDDETSSTNELSNLLSEHKQVNILATVNDPLCAIATIIKHKPNLLFLDIQMPEMDGFQLLEALNHTYDKPFVIFVTAFDKFAIQAVRAAAFDYLLKPVDRNELSLAIERFTSIHKHENYEKHYTQLIEQAAKKKIKFNTTGGFTLIDPQEIIYIQADWNYSEIHFSKDKHDVVALNLGTVENMLPKGCFARINRSVIVNVSYLDKVQRAKRKCFLKKDDVTYEFKIPIIRIRFLEEMF